MPRYHPSGTSGREQVIGSALFRASPEPVPPGGGGGLGLGVRFLLSPRRLLAVLLLGGVALLWASSDSLPGGAGTWDEASDSDTRQTALRRSTPLQPAAAASKHREEEEEEQQHEDDLSEGPAPPLRRQQEKETADEELYDDADDDGGARAGREVDDDDRPSATLTAGDEDAAPPRDVKTQAAAAASNDELHLAEQDREEGEEDDDDDDDVVRPANGPPAASTSNTEEEEEEEEPHPEEEAHPRYRASMDSSVHVIGSATSTSKPRDPAMLPPPAAADALVQRHVDAEEEEEDQDALEAEEEAIKGILDAKLGAEEDELPGAPPPEEQRHDEGAPPSSATTGEVVEDGEEDDATPHEIVFEGHDEHGDPKVQTDTKFEDAEDISPQQTSPVVEPEMAATSDGGDSTLLHLPNATDTIPTTKKAEKEDEEPSSPAVVAKTTGSILDALLEEAQNLALEGSPGGMSAAEMAEMEQEKAELGGTLEHDELLPCADIRIKAMCTARPSECKWTSKHEAKGFYCTHLLPCTDKAYERKASCVARADCEWVRVTSSKYGCVSVEAVPSSSSSSVVVAPPTSPLVTKHHDETEEEDGEGEGEGDDDAAAVVVAHKDQRDEETREEEDAVVSESVVSGTTGALDAATGEPRSEEDEGATDSSPSPSKTSRACPDIHSRTNCQERPDCHWKYPITHKVGHYCVTVTRSPTSWLNVSSEEVAVFDGAVKSRGNPARTATLVDRFQKTKFGPSTVTDFTCALHPECGPRDNVTAQFPEAAATYKQTSCCRYHPYLREMLGTVADFFQTQNLGSSWWVGRDELDAVFRNEGALLPHVTSVTVNVAIFGSTSTKAADSRIFVGSAVAAGSAFSGTMSTAGSGNSSSSFSSSSSSSSSNTPYMKSSKLDFVIRMLRFNKGAVYRPFVLKACYTRFALEKTSKSPVTYDDAWLLSTRVAEEAKCTVVSKSTSVPSTKTVEYFTVSHMDMDPSPILRIVPRILRGSCMDVWRPLAPDMAIPAAWDPLPWNWILPTVPCPIRLHGKVVKCPKEATRVFTWNSLRSGLGSGSGSKR